MTYLQDIMDEMGLSQKVLGKWLSLNQGKLSSILSQRCLPNERERKKLEAAFGGLPIELLLEDLDGYSEAEMA
jgi:ribosome-binding protein aMBF1 (putative translation factor)